MMGHLGFSYVGLLFMLMLFIPNIMWAKRQPQGYSAENENKILLMLERVGEVLATCCALFFSDFNLHGISKWCMRYGGSGILRVNENRLIFTAAFWAFRWQAPRCQCLRFFCWASMEKLYGC